MGLALRTGPFARLSEDPALAARVTVLPVAVQNAALPPRLVAVMGINMLGHLPPADRVALWERLSAALSPGAPAVCTPQPPVRPERIPGQPFGEAVVGARRYSASGAAEPAGPAQVRWRVTYRVHDGETLVFERTMENDWWVLDPAVIEAELRDGRTASGRDQRGVRKESPYRAFGYGPVLRVWAMGVAGCP